MTTGHHRRGKRQANLPVRKSSLQILRRIGSQRPGRVKQFGIGHGISVNGMPVVGLALPLGIFGPQQIGDGGKPCAVAVLENAKALGRLVHRRLRRLQREFRGLPVNVRLAYFQPHMLLRGGQLRVDLLFRSGLPRKLGAFAEGQNVDADLNAGHPVVAARTANGGPRSSSQFP